MSKEKGSKHKPTNVVAKLMGLEALPRRDKFFMDNEMLLHEEEKMAFIHQKFMEAKLLSRDQRLCKSKQFEDTLEVLSANSDLLIKLLDSQNSSYQLHFTPPPHETERISLLKPLKMVNHNDKSSRNGEKKKNDVDQSTRIVVLKPTSMRSQTPSPIEEKKKLHERWTMKEELDNKEQIQVRRNSTLGEMVSLSHIHKIGDVNEDQEPRKSVSCHHSFNEEKGIGDDSSKHLPRSNSVPPSSTFHETCLKVEVCDQNGGKTHGSKVVRKSNSMTSFKGKLSLFLFSRNKKSTKEKSGLSQSKDESQYCVTKTSVAPVDSTQVLKDDVDVSQGFEECSSLDKASSDSISITELQGMITLEPGLNIVTNISSENQDQPSPISVLDPSFEDDNVAHESLDSMNEAHQGPHDVPLKSNLIDKSPPIESIARTMSWNDSCAEVATPLMVSFLDNNKIEEQEWLILVEKLLAQAGFDDQVHYDSFHTRLHSLESPLDPSLRDNYANLNEMESQLLKESQKRKMRSNQKLVFDCVNASLLEIAGNYGSHKKYFKKSASPLLMDHIMDQMKELIACGTRHVWEECGDNNSVVVESLVRKEVFGIGWVELMEIEIDLLGREIEGDLIEEFVEHVVVDFKSRV